MSPVSSKVAMVLSLIQRYGEAAIWQQIPLIDNPDQPWNPGNGAPVQFPVTAMFQPYSRLNYETLKLRPNTSVPKSVLNAFFQTSAFAPAIGDSMIRNGQTYGVEFIDEVRTGSKLMYYEALIVA